MLAKLGRWHATGLLHRNLSEGGGEKGIEAWKRGSFIDGDAVSFLRDGDKKKRSMRIIVVERKAVGGDRNMGRESRGDGGLGPWHLGTIAKRFS